MRGIGWLLIPVALASAVPAGSQELGGFLVLEGDPGYLTNGYLQPDFATWSPEIETAFGAAGATGLLEWTGERTRISAAASGRWLGFADSTSAWRAYLVRGGLERRIGRSVALGADGSFSEIHRSTDRRTLWGQATVRWTASPRVRLTLGPGVARRTFTPSGQPEEGSGILDPPLPGGGSEGETAAVGETDATSYILFAGLEAWPGSRWRVRGDLYGARTEAADLGIDYGGGGGSLRLTRWLPNGASVTVGGGLEGFGYRAAAEATDGSTVEVPEDDLIWRAELGAGWPLSGRAELRARLAGLGRSGTGGTEGPDLYGSAGVRLTLGGILSGSRRSRIAWTRTPDGMRVEVPYDGPGRLYLAGDFNGWAEPGLPLRPAGEDVHEATLRLEPGSYRYRIRVVRDGEGRWLELPKGTPTVSDGFGGTNGLVVVGEDPAASVERREDGEIVR